MSIKKSPQTKSLQNKLFWNPSNLDLETLLGETEYRKHGDKYRYIIHKIIEETVLNKANENKLYVNLNAKMLKAIINSRQYTKVMKWLLLRRIVFRNYYHVGKSFGYRLNEEYANSKWIGVDVTDEKLIARLEKAQRADYDKTYCVHQFLIYNLHELRIKEDNAVLAIGAELANNPDYTLKKFNSDYIKIKKFARKEFSYKRDNTSFRIHNDFVNKSKRITPFLFLENGKQLYSIDIKNSQPAMLCYLLQQEHTLQPLQDVQAFIRLCQSGTLYEALNAQLQQPLDMTNTADRKLVKSALFAEVFYCKNSKKSSELKKIFRTLFPNVFDFICKQKETDYTQLAIKMQQAESSIVIDKVLFRIATENKPEDLFCLTVHDSCVTTEDNVDYVYNVLLEELSKQGIKVELEITPLKKV